MARKASVKGYFTVFAALLALTFLNIAITRAPAGPLTPGVSVMIACVQATLVVLYFMRVRYESRLIALYAASGFVFVALLIAITMSEVAGRLSPQGPDPLRARLAAPLPGGRR